MAVGKQTDIIRVEAGILDPEDGFVPFPAYSSPVSIKVWNASFSYVTEYLGSARTQSLTGYERAGIVGYRPVMNASLRNTTRAESENIATLLSYAGTWGSVNRPNIGGSPVPRNVPTVYRISPNSSSDNQAIYNLDSPSIEIARELTINSQVISLSFRGVEITNVIPDSVIV